MELRYMRTWAVVNQGLTLFCRALSTRSHGEGPACTARYRSRRQVGWRWPSPTFHFLVVPMKRGTYK
jgi:hypothetical protein